MTKPQDDQQSTSLGRFVRDLRPKESLAKPIAVRFTHETIEALDLIADSQGASRSYLVRAIATPMIRRRASFIKDSRRRRRRGKDGELMPLEDLDELVDDELDEEM